MSSSNLVRIGYKKEQTYGVTPPAVAATLVVQDITFTAVLKGEGGNDYSVEYLDTVTAGSEVATLTGKKISVAIEDGVSTATQVKAALDAVAAITAVVTNAITGTAGDAQTTFAEDNLAGGLYEFKTARFISENYSGTPQTTESAQIRTDRMSSGQVVTGLTVEGGHSFELAKETALEDFMESAMSSSWVSTPAVNGTFSINMSTFKLIRATGSFINEGVKVGRFLKLTNFALPANNVIIMAMVVTDLEVTFAYPAGMATASAEAATYQLCEYLEVGVTKKSLTVEKTFTDLTTKALIYKGSLVSQMELAIEYGSLISGSFTTSGNGYEAADIASEFASYQTGFKAPATSNSMNGSVDMPFVATDVTGTWGQEAFCLQSLNISLNNNLTVQNCIGRAAPENYSLGTAAVSASLSSYLKDGNWGLIAKKLSQAPFALGFAVANVDGWYGFYMPAIQVSFDDPQAGGANQEISLDMSGTAKVATDGGSSLTIYREPLV